MSPVMKKRLRIYAFAAGIVVAIMAGSTELREAPWPRAVLVVLGLVVGILNIRGKEQMDRFLIAAIGLNVTIGAFLKFAENADLPVQETLIVNFLIFVTAGLLYVSLAGIYEVFRDNLKSYKAWIYIAALVLILLLWIFGEKANSSIIQIGSLALLVLGLVVGYFEGPKNPDEGNANFGGRFLIAAVGLQLSSSAIEEIGGTKYEVYEAFLKNLGAILQNTTVFTTSALLVIAFMSIFWVLDEITDDVQ